MNPQSTQMSSSLYLTAINQIVNYEWKDLPNVDTNCVCDIGLHVFKIVRLRILLQHFDISLVDGYYIIINEEQNSTLCIVNRV